LNIDKIIFIAVGRLGINKEQVLEMTPLELKWAIEAKNDELDTLIRAVWESTRIQTVYLLNIHLKREHQIRKPEKLFKLKWDIEESKIEDWREIKNKLLLITKLNNKQK